MTDNREKELFSTLAALVTGVNVIQLDVKEIKNTLSEHSRILDNHSQILNEHSQILDKHSQILDKHSQILNRLDAKTDSIAETVLKNDRRLTGVEKEVADLRDGVH